jgi:hypothetical protein
MEAIDERVALTCGKKPHGNIGIQKVAKRLNDHPTSGSTGSPINPAPSESKRSAWTSSGTLRCEMKRQKVSAGHENNNHRTQRRTNHLQS